MNQRKDFFCFFLNIIIVCAAKLSPCTLKRDASYTAFTHFSNDTKAYEIFFNEAFSECATLSSVYDSISPLGDVDKYACASKREQAFVGFSFLSQDVELFTKFFVEKHPECGSRNEGDTIYANANKFNPQKDSHSLTIGVDNQYQATLQFTTSPPTDVVHVGRHFCLWNSTSDTKCPNAIASSMDKMVADVRHHRVVQKVKQIMSQCPGHLRRELSNLENTIKNIFDYRVDFCENINKAGPWNGLPHVAAKQVTSTVEKIGNIRPNSIVLDWGSGCGHRLAEIAKNNNGIGVGVELAGKLANWANRNRNADGTVFFCESNGRNMSWIPNETIDFSFSVGSVWLLSVNCSLECRYDDGTNSICKPKDTDSCIAACDAVKEMVRTTKKGGTIFIDHFDMSYPRESWQECLADMSESIDFVTIPSHQVHDWNGEHWYGETFYALIIAKRGEKDFRKGDALARAAFRLPNAPIMEAYKKSSFLGPSNALDGQKNDIRVEAELSVSTDEPAIAHLITSKNGSVIVCNVIPGYFANGRLQMPGECRLHVNIKWFSNQMREGETALLTRVIKGPMSEPHEVRATTTDPGTSWNVGSNGTATWSISLFQSAYYEITVSISRTIDKEEKTSSKRIPIRIVRGNLVEKQEDSDCSVGARICENEERN